MCENIFERPNINDLNIDKFEETVSVLYETKNLKNRHVRIEKIISYYNSTDWYDQDEDEFVCLLSGTAELEFEKGIVKELSQGDTIFIEKHKLHRVKSTTECNWLCIFCG